MKLIVFAILLVLAAASSEQHSPPNDGLPLVSADFTICTRVNPGTIEPPKRGDSMFPRKKDIA